MLDKPEGGEKWLMGVLLGFFFTENTSVCLAQVSIFKLLELLNL